MQAQPDPYPLEAIGLPPTWQPVPVVWRIASLDVQSAAGVDRLWVLIWDTPTGRQAYALPREALQRLIDQLSQQVTGLEVARAALPHGIVNGRN